MAPRVEGWLVTAEVEGGALPLLYMYECTGLQIQVRVLCFAFLHPKFHD